MNRSCKGLEKPAHLLRKRRVGDDHKNDGAIGSQQEMNLDEQELKTETSAPVLRAQGRR